MTKTVSEIFANYIPKNLPRKITNILFMLFNGADTVFTQLEYSLKQQLKERNFLTATNISSLRSLSAMNGFEPVLPIPSKGIISIKISPKLFARVGYPLYLIPNAIFLNKSSNLKYYYDVNNTLKIENDEVFVTLVEGISESKTFISENTNPLSIDIIKLTAQNIANNSIKVNINGVDFVEVKSFFDNEGLFDNNQFLVKFSNSSKNPLILYIKNVKFNDVVLVTYRLTNGEIGNIIDNSKFSTENIIDSSGNVIDIAEDEITISVLSGFNLGSNGTTPNALRSAIGFNHSTQLLFDSTSYTNYVNKFSTILQQKITHPIVDGLISKGINNIFVGNKQYINSFAGLDLVKTQYKNIIDLQTYKLSFDDKNNFSMLISENEFALSSHNIHDLETNKFAIQIMFENKQQLDKFGKILEQKIYNEFSKFLYDNMYILNLELFINNFIADNKCESFSYTLFNEEIEKIKLTTKQNSLTPNVIDSKIKLPILRGNFSISDDNYNNTPLFFDVNIVSKSNIFN
jgi:hypothetical protein